MEVSKLLKYRACWAAISYGIPPITTRSANANGKRSDERNRVRSRESSETAIHQEMSEECMSPLLQILQVLKKAPSIHPSLPQLVYEQYYERPLQISCRDHRFGIVDQCWGKTQFLKTPSRTFPLGTVSKGNQAHHRAMSSKEYMFCLISVVPGFKKEASFLCICETTHRDGILSLPRDVTDVTVTIEEAGVDITSRRCVPQHGQKGRVHQDPKTCPLGGMQRQDFEPEKHRTTWCWRPVLNEMVPQVIAY
ncbi:hypothetical protein BDZ97DRAFT_1755314 [Flammula alnicola]|nr:hypothetical protein BDZ97DRAFT_1755314 [Flammula alnicola]